MNHNHWPQELSKGRLQEQFFSSAKNVSQLRTTKTNLLYIDDQVPSWSTTLKICLGAMFYQGFN